MFNKAGAFGPQNSAWTETVARNNFGLGQNLNNLATDIYGGNFNKERDRQTSAIADAPRFYSGVDQYKNLPYDWKKSQLNYGGSQTTTPYFDNTWGGILSGGLAGFAASQLFNKKPG